MVRSPRAVTVVALLALVPHAHALVSSGHGRGHCRGHAQSSLSRTRMMAEPVPISVGDRRPLEVITRNIDRTQKAFPDELSYDEDTDVIDRLATIAAKKAELAGYADQALSFGGVDLLGAVLWTVVLWFGVLNDIYFERAQRPSDVVSFLSTHGAHPSNPLACSQTRPHPY